MKLPSIHSLLLSAKQVVLRFPLQILASAIATGICCYLANSDKSAIEEEYLSKMIMICNLSLTMLLAADLYAEVKGFDTKRKWALRLLVLLICTGLYFTLHPIRFTADLYRVAFLSLAGHLLVAFAPFISRGNLNGFWQFNKALFLRFLTSGLYASVLFAGLAIALVSINGLFNVQINSSTYMRLLSVVFPGFMTVFFLAGVPQDFEALDEESFYPKGLKIFTQYVLIPLMTIYLLILLVYEVKIMINWQLPKGLVSSLILGYAIFGILSLLLIYPIRDKAGNGWIKLFSKFFYVMMIPLVILLLLAIWKRVGNYGITESRYVLMVLSLWLLFITGYFLLSKAQNIKLIPISLCILCALAVYGPQSASSVSKYAQISRLKKLFVSKVQKDIEQREEVVSYLVERHGLTSLQPFTKVNLEELEQRMERKVKKNDFYGLKYDKRDTALALLKIEKGLSASNKKFITFENTEVTSVKGYDYIIQIDAYQRTIEKTLNGSPLIIGRENSDMMLKVKIGKELSVDFDVFLLANALKTELKSNNNEKFKLINGNPNTYSVPQQSMSITRKFAHYDLTFVASSVGIDEEAKSETRRNSWTSFSGSLLIRLK